MIRSSRLRWQCRRGTRELDILLGNYLEHQYQNANSKERQCFVDLLALEDSELSRYLMDDKLLVPKKLMGLVKKIQCLKNSA